MKKQENEESLKSALALTMAFLILFLIIGWKWTLYTALLIGLTGIVSPHLTRKIHFLWMKLAFVLNLVIPKIILGSLFYFILTPIAFFARLSRKEDYLLLKKSQGSTYKEVNKSFGKSNFKNPW